jgi:hypothetical protein
MPSHTCKCHGVTARAGPRHSASVARGHRGHCLEATGARCKGFVVVVSGYRPISSNVQGFRRRFVWSPSQFDCLLDCKISDTLILFFSRQKNTRTVYNVDWHISGSTTACSCKTCIDLLRRWDAVHRARSLDTDSCSLNEEVNTIRPEERHPN